MSEAQIAGIDKPLSRLALGTAFYTVEDRVRWFVLLNRFMELGGTVIDSARTYAGGQSERVLGEWLDVTGMRDKVVLITKCGHGENILPDGDLHTLFEEEVGESLRTLRTDSIDVLMLHRDNPAVPVEGIIDALNADGPQSAARAFGASNWTYPRIDAANDYARANGARGFSAVSNTLSLARAAEPFFPGLESVDEVGEHWHQETGIPLIPWSAQARGFFSGIFTKHMRGATEDPHARRMLEVYGSDANFERFARAEQLGRELGGYSTTQVALAWVLHRPIPVIPIIGPRNIAELEACFEAASITLTAKQCAWLDSGTSD